MAQVIMPKMGDGMTEGTILRWLKKEGDTVEIGDIIAEVETDKASVELPAEASGKLTNILAKEGDTVPVGTVIAEILGEGEQPQVTSPTEPAVAAEQPAAPGGEIAVPETGVSPTEAPARERVKASPLARRIAEEAGIDLAMVRGTGPGGRIVERDVPRGKLPLACLPQSRLLLCLLLRSPYSPGVSRSAGCAGSLRNAPR
jgi:pyruvate dehydrogenase E2 component (dihydrolipoamide acetyltransferase)